MTKTPQEIQVINGAELLSWTLSKSTAPTLQPDARTMSATILFTDIVDSTGLAARMGNRRWGEVVAAFYEAVRREVQTNSGKVIHGAGDGFLIVFDTPTRAIRCARAIRDAVRDLELEVRAGLHTGEFEYLGSDIAGIAVHIAARVATTAHPGEVLVTSTIKELSVGSDVEFSDRGVYRLKGVPGEWHLYRAENPTTEPLGSRPPGKGGLGLRDGAHLAFAWHWRGGVFSMVALAMVVAAIFFVPYLSRQLQPRSAGITPPEKAALPPPSIPSIAVLPFTNLSADPQQEYFSDGITDELITTLSRLSHLLVIARTSSFTYKNKPVRAQQIGRELGVKYLLEGSVRKSADQVRIAARLVEADNGAELWADHFDSPLREIFALQDRIVQRIATTLNLQVSLSERGVVVRQATNNPEAYDAFLRGLVYKFRENQEDDAKALRWFEKAVELDPNYADAYLEMSATIFLDWGWQWTPDPHALDRSFEFAQKALALDDMQPTAHVILGRILAEQRQFDTAVAETTRGIALAPNETGNYACLASGISDWAAETMIISGRPADGLKIAEKAMRRDPGNSDFHLMAIGLAYYQMGRPTDAISALKRFIEAYPPFMEAWYILAASYAEAGMIKEARAAVAEVLKLSPGFSLAGVRDPDPQGHLISDLRKAGLK